MMLPTLRKLQMPIPHSTNDFSVVQYADDTIMIMQADMEQVMHLKRSWTVFLFPRVSK
jgi:hypothetical protein